MTPFFISVFLVYLILLLLLLAGWRRLHRTSSLHGASVNHSVSVVIAFRNEAHNLHAMIQSLKKQTYTTSQWEVILVDDHSVDDSAQIALHENLPFLKVLQLPQDKSGKKAALDYGILQAQGNLIAVSDMDCLLPPQWLTKINEGFQEDTIQMRVGAVVIQPATSLFSAMQSIEFLSLIGSAGATLGWNAPTMCNGANLAFRKSAYLAVNGYAGNENIPSGDDEFLMRKIASKSRESVRFLFDSNTVVITRAQPSLSDFIQQRLRWAGKWKHNSSHFTKAVALAVLSFHLCFLLSIVAAFLGLVDWKVIIGLWLSKIITEALFLRTIGSFLGHTWSWISFFLLQLTHSFYVVSVGMLSQVKGYEWKGRRWESGKSSLKH